MNRYEQSMSTDRLRAESLLFRDTYLGVELFFWPPPSVRAPGVVNTFGLFAQLHDKISHQGGVTSWSDKG